MIRGFAGALFAGAFIFASPAALAQPVDCDAWAASDEAWPEIETILRSNYAYLGRVDDVDQLMTRAAAGAAQATSVGELGTIAESLGYAFRDGHFHVRPVAGVERAWIPSSSDFWVEPRGDGFAIADVRRGSRAYDMGLRPGWELIAMDAKPIAGLARAALAPVVAEPTPQQLAYAVNVVIAGRIGEARSFTMRHDGVTRAIDLPPAQDALGQRPEGLIQTIEKDGITHIRFNNSLGDNATIPAFDAAMAKIEAEGTEGLIIDLRDTPSGGNTTVARAILGWFMREPAIYQIHRNAYEQAVFGVPRQYAEYVFTRGPGQESARAYPVVVLAGYWSGSVGEALAMAFDRTANIPTIGTRLADLLGTLNRNQTENGCMTLSFAWDSLYANDGTAREDWEPRVMLASGDTAPDGSDPGLAAALGMLAGEADRAARTR